MPKFVIERDLPGAGKLSEADLRGIATKSCEVLGQLGPRIQWIESYVTEDRIYCVYLALNEELIREHAKRGGFPATRVSRVTSMLSPTDGGA